MKTIRTFKDKKTGLQMAEVSMTLPFEITDILPAVAKLDGHEPDYLATCALRSYMAAWEGPTCDDEPTDEERQAFGLGPRQAAAMA
jgi:hypothetical protein